MCACAHGLNWCLTRRAAVGEYGWLNDGHRNSVVPRRGSRNRRNGFIECVQLLVDLRCRGCLYFLCSFSDES